MELRPDRGKPVIHVAHCPERVLPGKIIEEMVGNDRIIEVPVSDATTGEMAKLVEKSFRDVNISFTNEIAVISAQFGIKVWELSELANHHPRVNTLQPGPGLGGHGLQLTHGSLCPELSIREMNAS